MSEDAFKPELFQRQDESDDPLFYEQPRLLAHIDDYAIAAARKLYGELLPKHGAVLDLMSAYLSHMPAELEWTRLCGLGMNADELRANAQLTEWVVHDLNAEPALPFADGEFDGAVVTVSVQYMTRPVETFREIARVLRPGAPFIVTYSNRLFPTKAVRVWQSLDDRDRARLVAAYFQNSGGFGDVSADNRTIDDGTLHDPLFAVWARKRVAADS